MLLLSFLFGMGSAESTRSVISPVQYPSRQSAAPKPSRESSQQRRTKQGAAAAGQQQQKQRRQQWRLKISNCGSSWRCWRMSGCHTMILGRVRARGSTCSLMPWACTKSAAAAAATQDDAATATAAGVAPPPPPPQQQQASHYWCSSGSSWRCWGWLGCHSLTSGRVVLRW